MRGGCGEGKGGIGGGDGCRGNEGGEETNRHQRRETKQHHWRTEFTPQFTDLSTSAEFWNATLKRKIAEKRTSTTLQQTTLLI